MRQKRGYFQGVIHIFLRLRAERGREPRLFNVLKLQRGARNRRVRKSSSAPSELHYHRASTGAGSYKSKATAEMLKNKYIVRNNLLGNLVLNF